MMSPNEARELITDLIGDRNELLDQRSALLAACEYGHDEHAPDRLAKRLEDVDGFAGFVVWLRRKAELERDAIAKAKEE